VNLFLIGWNLSQTERQRAIEVLTAMHETFPLLDASTIDSWSNGRGFACWMHHAPSVLGPRQYVHRSNGSLVLYDGVTVAPSDRFAAHDARELEAHWDTLSDDLEGHFAVARLRDRPDTLEILNDPNGIHPTYVHRRGDRWWIANRVRLLAGAAGLTALDLEGVATFVGVHWPGADRTLVEGVTKMPGAQRWRWQGDTEPETTTYWPVADLARVRRRRFGAREAAALAEEMHAPMRVLTDAFGPLDCPITAGHDTRMLTALTMTTGRPADYVTFGAPEDVDVIHATAIARELGLPHKRYEAPTDRSLEAWDEVNRRLVQRNDGMVSLMIGRSTLDPPERVDCIAVTLYGGGGELTRGKLLTPRLVMRPSVAGAIAMVQQRLDRGGNIQRPEARQTVRDHLERTCRALLELGFDVLDVPTAFEMMEHDRRGGAIQTFQRSDNVDVFVPFYLRTYVRTAFAVRPVERLLQRVPHHLIHHLSPVLRAMPSDSPWPPNSLAAHAIATTWQRALARIRRSRPRSKHTAQAVSAKRHNWVAMLSEQLPRWRERYLDRRDSSAWQVIDRARFEHLTSERATDAEKGASFEGLFLAATVLAFEEDLEAWTGRWR